MAHSSLQSKTLFCMPNDDAGAHMWMLNFARQVAENPAAIGLTAEQSERMTAAAAVFDAAYFAANNPATRTTVNVRAKNEARSQAVMVARSLINAIKRTHTLTAAQMINLGIESRNSAAKQRARRRAVVAGMFQ